MNKTISSYFLTIIGLALLAIGLYSIKTIEDPEGLLRTLPYICIGLGCGIFGHGMGEIISKRAIKNSPATAKQIEIDRKDERNLAITYRAKAKAYDLMIFVFGSLMLAFSLMNVDMAAVLLLVLAYLVVIGYGIYYRFKYDKEM